MNVECYVPVNKATGKVYANAVAETIAECEIYLSMIELDPDELVNIEIVVASLTPDVEIEIKK